MSARIMAPFTRPRMANALPSSPTSLTCTSGYFGSGILIPRSQVLDPHDDLLDRVAHVHRSLSVERHRAVITPPGDRLLHVRPAPDGAEERVAQSRRQLPRIAHADHRCLILVPVP